MKGSVGIFAALAVAVAIVAVSCASDDANRGATGQIFLYGEAHGVERLMNRQLEIWGDYYHNHGMRHLFIEWTYFTAEFLNVWMRQDNDDILYELYNDWQGSGADEPIYLEFFRTIKRDFPETVFHGVDILQWQYPTGRRFLQHLEDNDMQGSDVYLLTLEALEQVEEQGRRLAERGYVDSEFRVTKMAENFIRAFDELGGQSVMGIFGAAHTTLGFYEREATDIRTFAERLSERYGDSLHLTDLRLWMSTVPIRVDVVSINGVDYEAAYFGTNFFEREDFVSLSFWRLENAYDDFRNKPTNGDWLPADNYPMPIETYQVFFLDVTMTDGSVLREFFRSDGEELESRVITTGFSVD